MTRALNKAQIIGNLGQEPELKYVGSGAAVCNLRVATNETWTDRDGNQQQKTEWHTVVCWEKLAEVVNEHLSKGSRIYVEGPMETREWTDRDGNDRQNTQIKARNVIFLDGDAQPAEQATPQKQPAGEGGPEFKPNDELPFD